MKLKPINTAPGLFVICILLGILLTSCVGSMEPASDVNGIRINMMLKSADSNRLSVLKTGCVVDSVAITDVGVVISSVKFAATEDDSTEDFVIAEPHLVKLDLSGRIVPVDTIAITPGTYRKVEIRIDKLNPGNPADSSLIAVYPEFANLSILIKGNFINDDATEKPFTFESDLQHEIEIEFSPNLIIDPVLAEQIALGTAITIEIDPARWFLTEDSRWLDPSNPQNHRRIEKNIKSALKAFEDADEDGECDDEKKAANEINPPLISPLPSLSLPTFFAGHGAS